MTSTTKCGPGRLGGTDRLCEAHLGGNYRSVSSYDPSTGLLLRNSKKVTIIRNPIMYYIPILTYHGKLT